MERGIIRAMKLKVLIHPAEEGGFWAEAPALPGCVSEGDTLDEALDNIREAALGWLEVAAERVLPGRGEKRQESGEDPCTETTDGGRWHIPSNLLL